MTGGCRRCGVKIAGRAREYCGTDCYHADRRAKIGAGPVKSKCGTCGEVFDAAPSEVRRGGGKFCSPECSQKRERVRSRTAEAPCAQCGDLFWSRAHTNQKCCSLRCAGLAKSGPDRPPTDRNCAQCGCPFTINRPSFAADGNGKYCSRACSGIARAKPMVTIECACCSKRFDVHPGYSARARYCSQECGHAGSRRRIDAKCAHCAAAFVTSPGRIANGRVHCSIACTRAARMNWYSLAGRNVTLADLAAVAGVTLSSMHTRLKRASIVPGADVPGRVLLRPASKRSTEPR